ncbi:hypothetical protein D3C84_1021700 [compost metagenome]
MFCRLTRLRPRANSTRARDNSASAVARVARSTSLSIWISGWPSLIFSPERKSTSWTVPLASTVRSTPWKAFSVPMAGRRLCQGSSTAFSAETLMGGWGAENCWICW